MVKKVEVKKIDNAKKTINKKLGVVKYKITQNKTISTSHKKTNKKWILFNLFK